LHLAPNIPAANFWSSTVYGAENASGLANGQAFPSLGLRDKPVQNADGSTDLRWGLGLLTYQIAAASMLTTPALACAQVAQVPHNAFSLWNNYQTNFPEIRGRVYPQSD
jgi:Protein of unknown function (DUF1214)